MSKLPEVRQRFRRQLSDDQAYLCRRLVMIEMRRYWPVELVAACFACSTSLVRQECRKGYPIELDDELAERTARAVRDAAEWWAERETAG